MDLDEVSKLCASLNLDDDDGPVVEMSPAIYSNDKDGLELCLVGKFLEQIGSNNVFLFHFSTKEYRQHVLAGSPWLFEKQIISLVIPTGIGEIASMNFSEVSFWIQIWNVPVAWMTEKCAIFLGNLIKVLEDTEVSGSQMQICVLTVELLGTDIRNAQGGGMTGMIPIV
ncbi:hypothetical protein PanWU01x14_255950 [Parasponia andersonii]|uniref:Uncharacterized protein n=1 Tax=Parasponia andersonii TaxID=3476 RepID=A0A2P5BAK8_PARAD|nr:hypothetical protein PanWU01x14_255950 [Parasponia andersonii]